VGRRQHTARDSLPLAVAVAVTLLTGCVSDTSFDAEDLGTRLRYDVLDAALERSEPPASGDLRIRLAFGGGADLDLYVTDTLRESIYFARRKTRSGGFLEADARCDSAPPRIETAVYPAAAPGVYRIGVDYAGACAEKAEPAGFVVEVSYGAGRWLRRDYARPSHFEPLVWEVVVPGGETTGSRAD